MAGQESENVIYHSDQGDLFITNCGSGDQVFPCKGPANQMDMSLRMLALVADVQVSTDNKASTR